MRKGKRKNILLGFFVCWTHFRKSYFLCTRILCFFHVLCFHTLSIIKSWFSLGLIMYFIFHFSRTTLKTYSWVTSLPEVEACNKLVRGLNLSHLNFCLSNLTCPTLFTLFFNIKFCTKSLWIAQCYLKWRFLSSSTHLFQIYRHNYNAQEINNT